MKDVKWREFTEENWALLKHLPKATVLVDTYITYRIDTAQNLDIEQGMPYLRSALETAVRFAFI